MQYNPIDYSDPTGHQICEETECRGYHPPTSTFPEVTITVSSNFPLTQAEAPRYMELANTAGWWNHYQTGNFSVLDYVQLLLSMEYSTLKGVSGKMLQELIVRDFYARCTGYCNPNSDFDLLRYVAIKGLNTPPIRTAAPGTINEKLPRNLTDFKSAFTHPEEAWKTGCGDGNVPCNWGNKSLRECNETTCAWLFKNGPVDMEAVRKRIDAAAGVSSDTISTTYDHFYYKWGGNDPKNKDEDYWFVLTGNQGYYLYGQK